MIPGLYTFEVTNGQIVEWGPMIDGLTDNIVLPTYLNALTGTATLLDPAGVPRPELNAAAFVYVTASNGIYRASCLNPFAAPLGKGYTLVIEFSLTGIVLYHAELPAQVVTRRTS